MLNSMPRSYASRFLITASVSAALWIGIGTIIFTGLQ